MNIRIFPAGITVLVLSLAQVHGATAAQLIAQGRTQLTADQVPAARDSFFAAAAAEPANAEAQTLAAITEILAVWEDPALQALLPRLGVLGGGTVKDPTVVVPIHGPQPAAGANLNEFTGTAVNNLLPLVQDVDQRLAAALANGPGLIHLSAAETGTGLEVDLDRGDLLVLRALAQGYIAGALLTKGVNSDALLTELFRFGRHDLLTAEHIRHRFPQLFARPSGAAAPADLAAAQSAVALGIQLYNDGSTFIRTQRTNPQPLFDLAVEEHADEADFRARLAQVQTALAGPVEVHPGWNVDLRPVFDGTADPVALFPKFSLNALAPNSIPDPTFAGLLPGQTQSSLANHLSKVTFSYIVHDLGTLGGNSYAYAINNHGQVVGSSAITGSYDDYGYSIEHAFRWTPATGMVDLGTLGGSLSYAYDVNDAGTIVGEAENASFRSHAFSYANGTMIDLGTPPGDTGSWASSINAAGQIVGTSYSENESTFDFGYRAFYSSGGTMTDLSPLLGSSYAYGINDSGQIVGEHEAGAFILTGNTVTELSTLFGGLYSRAVAINNGGQVAGSVFDDDFYYSSAFLYSAGNVSILTTGYARGINNAGHVVGEYFDYTAGDAFLYANNTVEMLTEKIGHVGWRFYLASDINDQGQIVGDGYGPADSSSPRAFLLNPATPTWLAINAQPASEFSLSGNTVEISARVTGFSAPAYQWQRQPAGSGVWSNMTEGGAYSGATGPVLVIANTSVAMSGDRFRLVASNSVGNVTTQAVALAVVEAATNDNFTDATTLAGSNLTATGNNFETTTEAGEPDPYFLGELRSVWWQWTAPASGQVSLDTIGSDFDTVLGVYTGGSLNALTQIALNDDGDDTTSALQFSATAGTTYRFMVFGWYGATGNISLHLRLITAARTTWFEGNFTPAQRNDQTISGNDADPDRDGLNNFLEYAFNLNPLAPDTATQIATSETVGGALRLVYQPLRPELTYTAQASTDMVNWSTSGVSVTVNGGIVTASRILPPGGRVFLRILVSENP